MDEEMNSKKAREIKKIVKAMYTEVVNKDDLKWIFKQAKKQYNASNGK